MSLLDYLRQDYVKGKVIEKYRLKSSNIGMVVEEEDSKKRYHVEFKDNGRGPSIENLFGLLEYPFEGKTDQVDRLVNEGDSVELTVSYSKARCGRPTTFILFTVTRLTESRETRSVYPTEQPKHPDIEANWEQFYSEH
jgi:hypothetical protein